VNADELNQFLRGGLVVACLVVALFFIRYYRQSQDRLFLFFIAAFASFAAHWTALAVVNPAHESRHLIFVLRLLGFALILLGVIDKNRRSRG
jgi:hypothetical protein